jgi:trk system potassium uptake protein TrkA
LATRLSLFGVSDFLPVLPNYSVVLLKTPNCFLNQTISVMESKSVQVVGIQRGKEVILTPSDQETLLSGDMLILIGENKDLNRLAERIESE